MCLEKGLSGLDWLVKFPSSSVCHGIGWVQDAFWCPASLRCLIADISKLKLESDLAADVARTSLTKLY